MPGSTWLLEDLKWCNIGESVIDDHISNRCVATIRCSCILQRYVSITSKCVLVTKCCAIAYLKQEINMPKFPRLFTSRHVLLIERKSRNASRDGDSAWFDSRAAPPGPCCAASQHHHLLLQTNGATSSIPLNEGHADGIARASEDYPSSVWDEWESQQPVHQQLGGYMLVE